MALNYEPHILRLSDDILLQIMSFLKLEDILTVAQVCSRLEKISKDRTLWKEADLRPRFLTHAELEDAVKCFHRGTKVLASTGSVKLLSGKVQENTECLSPALFELVTQFTDLETLILEEHFINASILTYKCFPSTLKHLSMENCKLINVPVKESYFFNMATQTSHLESLNLNGCLWFEDHSMMAISKCPKLRILRLRGCVKVGTCAAYIFLSARFGFENIEVLDLRETAISDAEVRAFKSKPKLKRMYIDGRVHRKQDSDEIDRVTDRGINTPEEYAPHLEVLTLTNTEVSDVTLRHLARNMPNLQLIDVRGSKVTEPGVIRLKTEFPLLRVVCDFPEWTVDSSLISPDWWIDRDFIFQDDVKRHPSLVSTSRDATAEPPRHERIEIIDVGPGMVRLRRIIDRPVFPLPVPPEVVPEPASRQPPQLQSPRPEDQELPRSPESLRSSSSGSSSPSQLDNTHNPKDPSV